MIDKKILWMVVVLSLMMVACSPSEEEAYSDAKSQVKEAVLADQVKEPNKELENFSLYVPEDLNIIEQGPTNVFFKKMTSLMSCSLMSLRNRIVNIYIISYLKKMRYI